ncbi:MAG TPA: hypothetical protein QF753_07655 [Victivallales bacterium]|nr:hypothetical protein [Victivallales bacterium]
MISIERISNNLTNIILIISLLFITSCSSIITSRKQKEPLVQSYKTGNKEKTAELLKEYLESRKGTGDELMWWLEEGSLKFEMKDYKGSLFALNEAERIIDDYGDRAVINARHIGSEGGSLLTNPNAIPYYGYNYDKILLNTYKALNYFALSEPESARVELRKAYERQKDAKELFELELRDELRELEYDRTHDRDLPKVSDVLNNQNLRNEYKKMLKYSQDSRYAGFINPFTTYLLAVGYLTEGDYDEAYIDLNELYKINPGNRLIQKDLVTCATNSGRKIPDELKNVSPNKYSMENNIVYIISAKGLAPAFKENKLQLVLPEVGYTGFAYPSIEYPGTVIYDIEVSDSKGDKYPMYKIADLDNIISQEFKEYFMLRVSRIAASVLAKEAATIAALKAVEGTENSELIKLGILIAASLYKAAFNTADTRSWQLLPNEFFITNLPIPKDGIINIWQESGNQCGKNVKVKIDRDKGDKVIIFVRTPGGNRVETILCQFF